MATYVVGDIQGCYDSLRKLLDTVKFNPSSDQLWCAGDMVNRGKDSLLTLRYLRSLGDAAVCVLGNHDIHLLEQAAGAPSRPKDTLDQVLAANDADELLDWLRHRPLLHHDKTMQLTMVHAGLSPRWSFKKACRRAQSVERLIRQDDWKKTFNYWQQCSLPEWEPIKGDPHRILFAMAVLTNTRFCNKQGRFNWQANHTAIEREGDQPWYAHTHLPWHCDAGIVMFGHWAAKGLVLDQPHVLGLDSGCVWGGHLTLARVDHRPFKLTKLRCACCLPVL